MVIVNSDSTGTLVSLEEDHEDRKHNNDPHRSSSSRAGVLLRVDPWNRQSPNRNRQPLHHSPPQSQPIIPQSQPSQQEVDVEEDEEEYDDHDDEDEEEAFPLQCQPRFHRETRREDEKVFQDPVSALLVSEEDPYDDNHHKRPRHDHAIPGMLNRKSSSSSKDPLPHQSPHPLHPSTIVMRPTALLLPEKEDPSSPRTRTRACLYLPEDPDIAVDEHLPEALWESARALLRSSSNTTTNTDYTTANHTTTSTDHHHHHNKCGDSLPPHHVLYTAAETEENKGHTNHHATNEAAAVLPVPPRVLYVCQGEIAHVVPTHADVLMSDRATTCHLLVLRSTWTLEQDLKSPWLSSKPPPLLPLTSLAHIDDVVYKDCLRDTLQRHYEYWHPTTETKPPLRRRAGSSAPRQRGGIVVHHHPKQQKQQQQKPYDDSTKPSGTIHVDIHIVGGFVDATSRRISAWLLHTLASIANEYDAERKGMQFTLQTALISRVNNHPIILEKDDCDDDDDVNHNNAPMACGVAIHLLSGRLHLARAQADLIPAFALRSARLFAPDWSRRSLSTIWEPSNHHHGDGEAHSLMMIAPFALGRTTTTDLDLLLSLNDAQLLMSTSTSPHCEHAEFCRELRCTLQLLRKSHDHHPHPHAGQAVAVATQWFGPHLSEPLRLQRVGHSNQWKTMTCSSTQSPTSRHHHHHHHSTMHSTGSRRSSAVMIQSSRWFQGSGRTIDK